jgi:hypothetical protein
MSNFTQLNLQGNSNGKPMPKSQPTPGLGGKPMPGSRPTEKPNNKKQNGSAKVATIAGSLVIATAVVIFTIGVHHNNKPTPKIATASSPMPIPVSQTMPVAPAVPAKAAKKSPRQHKLATFKSADYALSFRYPVHYTLKEGEEMDPNQAAVESGAMNFVQSGGTTLSTIELPGSFYAGTDFTSAFFTVNVNPRMTASECSQFAFPEKSELDNNSDGPEEVNVAGTDYTEMDDVVSDGAVQANARYYHLYQNNTCYEFALGLQTTGDDTKKDLKVVNRDKVFDKLQWMLATVKIKTTEPTPQVAKTTDAPSTSTAANSTAPATEVSTTPNNQ